MGISLMQMTKEDLECHLDIGKVTFLQGLVNEGFITGEQAEEWARTHTIVLQEKTFFRTLTALWDKETKCSGTYCLKLVKLVEPEVPSTEDEPEEEAEAEPTADGHGPKEGAPS